MDNLPNNQIESNVESSSKSAEDDELDPRIQVRCSESLFIKFYFL